MQNNNGTEEWISVSELANRIGKTKQTAYNQIKAGLWQTKEFTRGTMKGILVLYRSDNKL